MAIIELVDRDSNAKGLIDKIRKEKKENEVDSSKSNKIENEIPEKKNLISKIKEEISEDSKTKSDSKTKGDSKKKEVDKS